MSEHKFRIGIPLGPLRNKVTVIKAIRTLTGLGLKEAKDISDESGNHILNLGAFFHGATPGTDAYRELENQFRILRAEGIEVGEPVYRLLEELRELGAQALRMAEDELADEIFQLILAEKLRRKPL